ncbi:hypothetical protein [Robiginitalea aurantiaca]|uniref:Lipoprotein n=1 Tax=Robiginitalea aurantiaca TaxID=3056915 RepID=A0ABT7WCB8_9FLAO|nr:hypothetical protein [Robiginitalea aurantiaca]MDM9630474.1 hypothetical protein [Robiginitalea aurantiaca]
MKPTALLTAFAFLILCGCKQEKNNETPSVTAAAALQGWTEEDRARFNSNCAGFLEAEGVEDSGKYCDCLLKSSMEKYPDVGSAMELEQTEIVSLFEQSECIDELLLVKIEHPWTEEAEELFKKHCKEGKMQQGISDDDAEKYCDCALAEVRELIPNPHHVISLTEEELLQIFNKCQQ